MQLEPHQQRVVDEKAALDDKLFKLATFMATKVAVAPRIIPVDEGFRLYRQMAAMEAYSAILGERIAAFSKGIPAA